MTGPSQRREMAENAVARRGASIALACRAFGVSETCYRYGPKLRAENDHLRHLAAGALAEAERRAPRRDLVPLRQEITVFGGKRLGS